MTDNELWVLTTARALHVARRRQNEAEVAARAANNDCSVRTIEAANARALHDRAMAALRTADEVAAERAVWTI